MDALKVINDVNRTTEVNLRDTTVTFLNKLMKRVQKINYNLAYHKFNREKASPLHQAIFPTKIFHYSLFLIH